MSAGYSQRTARRTGSADLPKLGNDERLAAIRQLDAQARVLEGSVAGPSCDDFIANEKELAAEHGGRTVFGGS